MTSSTSDSAAPRPRPGIMDIAPYVGGRAAAPGVARVIKLSANESPLGASPLAVQAYGQAGGALNRYPDGAAHDLRQAIAACHGLDADRIVCGDGSDELLHLLALGFAGPGDEVLSTEFGFVVYPIVAKAVGATAVQAPEKNFTVDVDALLAGVTDKTRIVFIANPNSTGTYVPWAELSRLHDGLAGDVLLVIDSAYAEFAEAEDYSAGEALVTTSSNTVMIWPPGRDRCAQPIARAIQCDRSGPDGGDRGAGGRGIFGLGPGSCCLVATVVGKRTAESGPGASAQRHQFRPGPIPRGR